MRHISNPFLKPKEFLADLIAAIGLLVGLIIASIVVISFVVIWKITEILSKILSYIFVPILRPILHFIGRRIPTVYLRIMERRRRQHLDVFAAKLYILWRNKGNKEDVVELCDKFLQDSPDNIYALSVKCGALASLSRWAEVLGCSQIIENLETDSMRIPVLLVRAVCYTKLNRKDEALSCCDKILVADPNNEEAKKIKLSILQLSPAA